MTHTVQLSEESWNDVRRYASLNWRSITDQIEYWSRIGKIAEENPDLPYDIIRGILLSKQEAAEGELTEYQFGWRPMRVVETPHFRRSAKRLHRNQKDDLDRAVRTIAESSAIGEQKNSDLAWLRVHKFRMVNQISLLAYESSGADTIILHDLGSHENFYRDPKKQ
jgi:ParE-like toxin of type II bacterial toxin-antitoxin system/ParD-like antitoxin of type II bacterial toxin-antitoxin system